MDGKIDAPQTAQVGEVLTVEEVGEDGKPKKWKTQTVDVDGVLKYTKQELTTEEQAQARENIGAQQTDFIVNITHFDEVSNIVTVILDKTFDEIDAAYKSGRSAKLDDGNYKYYLYDVDYYTDSDGDAIAYTFINVDKYGFMQYISVDSRGNNIYEQKQIYKDSWSQLFISNNGWIAGCQLGLEASGQIANYVTVSNPSGLKSGKVLTTTGKNGILSMEWKDINFPVTITSTTTDGVTTYTADKTFAEIKAAYDSGANVYAVYRQGIVPLSGVYNDISAVFYGLLGEIGGKIICKINIDSDGVELEHSSPVPCVEWNNLIDGLANTPYVLIVEGDNAPDHGGLLFYYYGATSSKLGYKLFTYSGNLYTIEYDRRNNYISSKKTLSALPTVSISDNNKILQVLNGAWTKTELPASLPSPATAQVGQIVKVKAVDADGKITETETVDIPMQKTLKWITVHSSDLTETKRELIISTDTDGKSIVDYNPVGLSLIVSTPADATVESNNGSPWVYPSATKADNAIRVIGNISGWKTVARDSAFVFNGGSSAMSCSGNVNTSLATYKLDGYALDGVRIFFNSANDHLPVGTHVEVAILCEVAE